MCRGCIHQSFLSWRTIWDLSLSAILMHFTLSCRASQATKVQTPRGCQLPLGCHQLSGFSLGLENLSIHMILLLYKSTRCRRITRCIYMCIFGYCIFNPISAALHSAMACSSFPDPMNFWLKCFHIWKIYKFTKTKDDVHVWFQGDPNDEGNANNAALSFTFFSQGLVGMEQYLLWRGSRSALSSATSPD